MTPEREQYIRNMANDEWIDPDINDADFERESREWSKRTDEFVRTVTDPEELHLFANWWNWDCGSEALSLVVKNQHCDAATALMIYWRAQPQYYSRRVAEEMQGWEREGWELILQIQERYVAGQFPISNKVSYDPYEDDPNLRTRVHSVHEWIPKVMYEPVGKT